MVHRYGIVASISRLNCLIDYYGPYRSVQVERNLAVFQRFFCQFLLFLDTHPSPDGDATRTGLPDIPNYLGVASDEDRVTGRLGYIRVLIRQVFAALILVYTEHDRFLLFGERILISFLVTSEHCQVSKKRQ